MKRMSSKLKLTTVILLLLPLLSLPEITEAHATSSTISGQVIEGVTGAPLENALITVWEYQVPIRRRPYNIPSTTLRATTTTGLDGRFEITINDDFSCRVYVSCDDPNTSGIDYLPQLYNFNLATNNEIHILCEMMPAASILFEGDLLIVDSARPPDTYSFTMVVKNEFTQCEACIINYGTTSGTHNQYVNVSQMQMLVPVGTPVGIKVQAFTPKNHVFYINDLQLLNFQKGDEVHLSITNYSMPYNLNLTMSYLQLVTTHVTEAEQQGFYVLAEHRDLEKVQAYISNAQTMLNEALYRECYTDLREAYTKAAYIDENVQALTIEASHSTIYILFFLALTSAAISYLVFDQRCQQGLATGLCYIVFTIIFYTIYAGCRVIPNTTFILSAGASLLIAVILVILVPSVLPLLTPIVFSMAKRNIKARRARFLLPLISVTTLVLSFVAFTSFSTENGFTSTFLGNLDLESEGLLLRHPLPPISSMQADTLFVSTFTPLQTAVPDWLHQQQEVTLIAPKVENIASRRPIGSLSSSTQRQLLYGVLGIAPSSEANITGFDKLLLDRYGRYLDDHEEYSIMISLQMAEALDTQIGDQITLSVGSTSIMVQVVGLLDDYGLQNIHDFDGKPMIPEKLIITVEDGIVVEGKIVPCASTEVVVLPWQTAQTLSSLISLSRIDAHVQNSVDLTAFARQIALERDYWVWTNEEAGIRLQGIMPYLEAKGIAIIIPWIITILSVILTMLNAISERRSEISILSSVGLNPTHITSLYGAEALFIGVLGGGIGYLLGLSTYSILPHLSADIIVRQKLSATWSLASLGIAVTSVLVGAGMALKSSVILTPSLLRTWKAQDKPQGNEPWIFTLPLRVPQTEIDSLFTHVKQQLTSSNEGNELRVSRVEELEETILNTITKSIKFRYYGTHGVDSFISHNEVRALKTDNDVSYNVKLICESSEESHAYDTARYVRKLVLEWSVARHE